MSNNKDKLLHFFRFYEHGYTDNEDGIYTFERWNDIRYVDNFKLYKYLHLTNTTDIVMEKMCMHYKSRNKDILTEIKNNYIVSSSLKHVDTLLSKYKIPFIYQFRSSYATYYILFANNRLKTCYFNMIHDKSLQLFHEVTLEFMPQKIKFDIDMPVVEYDNVKCNIKMSASVLIQRFIDYLISFTVNLYLARYMAYVNSIDDEIYAEYVKAWQFEYTNANNRCALFGIESVDSTRHKLLKIYLESTMTELKSWLSKPDASHIRVIWSDQSDVNKHSYHIIIDGLYCNNVHEVRAFVDMLREELMYTDMHILNKFIDMGIYKKTQHFRHMDSTKEGTLRYKNISEAIKHSIRKAVECNMKVDMNNIVDELAKCTDADKKQSLNNIKVAVESEQERQVEAFKTRYEINNVTNCKLMPSLLSVEKYKQLIVKFVSNSVDFQAELIDFLNSYFRANNIYVKYSGYERPFYKFDRYASGHCNECKKQHTNRSITAIASSEFIKWRCDFTENKYKYIPRENHSYDLQSLSFAKTIEVELYYFHNTITQNGAKITLCLEKHMSAIDTSNMIVYDTNFIGREVIHHYYTDLRHGIINAFKVLDNVITKGHGLTFVMPYGTIDILNKTHIKDTHRYYFICTVADLATCIDNMYYYTYLNVDKQTMIADGNDKEYIERIFEYNMTLNNELNKLIEECIV